LIEKDFTFSLDTSALVNYSRPSIDLTFFSAASAFREGLTGILLTGANKDGVEGMCIIKAYGGSTIVQEPGECPAPFMPLSAIGTGKVDMVLNTPEIIQHLRKISSKVFP
jgi:two-component system, chemotaxis family, protein-glutamate methylesterase/glutaminase